MIPSAKQSAGTPLASDGPDEVSPSERAPEIGAGEVVAEARATYRTGRTRPASWRRDQIEGLVRFLEEQEEAIADALARDLGRNAFEAWGGDIGVVRAEARHALDELDDWMRPRRVSVPLVFAPGRGEVVPEPLGVVLILGPWNYPFQLVLAPAVAALAAGNAVVLKPSEHAPASAELLARVLPGYVDPEAMRVVTGGVDVARALLEQRFDHVFFTGGTEVGRKVMQAAARHLTPVTLELGGKSPCIVDASADLDVTARRIVWGRFMNAGQTCVAPDYVLVEREVARALTDRMVQTLEAFYGEDPARSEDYARIVNHHHLQRLEQLLEGQEIIVGGESRPEDRYLAPTLVWNPDPETPLMQEEIFGPILPVIPVDDLEEALAFVDARPDPLALYLFSGRRSVQKKVRERTRSGGVCVNDTVVQVSVPELPFGGLGPSGMGAYHGRTGFETFSHIRSHLTRSTRVDPKLRYPPYDGLKLGVTRRLL